MNFSKYPYFTQHLTKGVCILRNSYLDNAIFKTDETLYMRWFNRVLHVYKVSGQNSKI